MVSVLGGIGNLVHKILFYSIQASTIFGFIRSAFTYIILPFIIAYTSIYYETSIERKQHKEKMLSYLIVLGVLASAFAGFVRIYNYAIIFYLIMFADFIYLLFKVKKHLILRVGTLICTLFLIFLTYIIHYQSTNTYYYDFFFPYTCILNETDEVYIREIAHLEAVNTEKQDNNVRDIN